MHELPARRSAKPLGSTSTNKATVWYLRSEITVLAFEMNLLGGGLDFCAVVETGVPVAAALRSEVHEVPDGSQQVDAALRDVGRHSRMRGVEEIGRASCRERV